MNLRFLHFGIDLTLLAALLAQCLALPSTLSPRAAECTEGFKVIISNNRTTEPKRGKGGSELYAYVSGQMDGKHGMLAWEEEDTKWHTLEASSNTSDSVHEKITPPEGMRFARAIGDDQTEFCMPKNVISGRVYIVEGELEFKTFLSGDKVAVDEPSAVAEGTDAYNKRWSFLEFTYEKDDHIVVNLSFVDWVSLALGFTLTTAEKTPPDPAAKTSENPPETTHTVPGLEPGGLAHVCDGLKDQSQHDNITHWRDLCVQKDSKLLRVLSPNQYATTMVDAWEGYYDDYWAKFGEQTKQKNFTINTQDEDGKKVADGKTITCTMPANKLICKGSAAEYEIGPPGHITDIWGCDRGMFDKTKYPNSIEYLEILPRLCAALVRSTLLLPGGDIQPNADIPPSLYYDPNKNQNGTQWPTNHYSRIVHDFLRNNTGYAFAYDDVGPDGHDSAGLIDTYYPKIWNITLSD